MTPDQRMQLFNINSEVNAIPFEELPGPHEPPDFWTDEPVAGDSWVCRDYCLRKADKLKAVGWPALSLTEVFCWVEPPPPPGGGYHAILAVETDDGVWFLDSRVDEPYPNRPPLPLAYTGDRRQIAGSIEYEPFSFA